MADRVEFGILLPPGWARIAVDERTIASIPALAEQLTKGAPAESRAATRELLQTHLQGAIRQALDHDGQDLIIATAPVRGMAVQMSIVVATPELPVKTASASDALLAFAGRDPDATAAGVDHELAVRRVAEVPAQRDDRGELVAPPSRRISYLVAPAAGPVLFVASILRLGYDGEDEVIEALEFLFDTLMGTVRFERGDLPAPSAAPAASASPGEPS